MRWKRQSKRYKRLGQIRELWNSIRITGLLGLADVSLFGKKMKKKKKITDALGLTAGSVFFRKVDMYLK